MFAVIVTQLVTLLRYEWLRLTEVNSACSL